VVPVTVGDENVGHTLADLVPVALEGGVAGEKRIDEHNLIGEIESECGMAEPGDLHEESSSLGSVKMGRVRCRTMFRKEQKAEHGL
jgi:hypothetical protein